MNLFSKNPFAKSTNTHIVGNNIKFDEKQKLENIKENMNKLKYQTNEPQQKQNELKPQNLQEKIEFLRNLNK